MTVKTYIHTVQSYLENEEIEDSQILKKFRTPDASKILKYTEKAKIITVANDSMISTKMNTIDEPEASHLKIPKTFASPSTGMEFILIPAGKFMMGSSLEENGVHKEEGPVHEVTIRNFFYIGKYPVTQKQWKKVMGSNPSNFTGEDQPVDQVSWNDIQEFIKILNENEDSDKYCLPSEAQWEYAARAGTSTSFFFSNDKLRLNEYAWYKKNSGAKTHPVGQKKPNPWDLYDIYGNVWEWVQDRWHSDYNGAPSDGSAWEDGDSSYRVYRGGSWYNFSRFCRSANRDGNGPQNCYSSLGFRLLRKL